MIQPLEFFKYDKISDDVYLLGQNMMLKFNVTLSKTSSTDKKRYTFYKEFEYPSKTDGSPLITIKRSFDYYFSIENVQKPQNLEKGFIRIGMQELFKFRNQLKTAHSWLTSDKFKTLFVYSKKKLALSSPVPECTLGGYPQGKFLRFMPAIIDRSEGTTGMEPGIRFDLSDYDNTVIMNIDRFMGLYYTIMEFNMYLAAQNLVGYLGIPYGANRYSMSSNSNAGIHSEEFTSGITSGVTGRMIGKKKNISSLE